MYTHTPHNMQKKMHASYTIHHTPYTIPGTSTKRSSCNDWYYTMGGRTIPGIKINGMNVLAVKQGMKAVKDWCASGNGPIYVELDTYR